VFHDEVSQPWRNFTSERWEVSFIYFYDKPECSEIIHQVILWLFLAYAFWLFSERYGRFLLAAYVVFVVFHDGILPLFNPRLAWAISDFITRGFMSSLPRYGHLGPSYLPLYFAIGFAFVIYLSFSRRRSYFW
jgi:hypothetical protein